MWQEDAWTFTRRMMGDQLCQKIFYEVCTITWILSGIEKGKGLHKYQYALIDIVFGHRNVKTFVMNQKQTPVLGLLTVNLKDF